MKHEAPAHLETAVLGGGCFWCLEAAYQQVKGIEKVVSGYAGGFTDNPTYMQVELTDTGHAEVVQLTYDPIMISYKDILEIFFTIHDPTTKDKQDWDTGPMYRSIILYADQEQKRTAEQALRAAQNLWDDPIVTEVKPLDRFYEAEDYHQNYYKRNPEQAYCRIIINPKLRKLRQKFRSRLKEMP